MTFIGDLGSAILGAAYEYRTALAVAAVVGAIAVVVLARRFGWLGSARRHPLLAGALLAVALVVGTPVAWYLVSPVFIRTELNEPPPVIAAREAVEREPSAAPAVVAPSAAPARPGPAAESPTPPPSPGSSPSPTSAPSAAPTAAPPRSGSFTGTDDFHFGRGTVTLLETAPGEWTLRFEDFAVRNGPDLYVYLSPDRTGWDRAAIEVARLKATDGSFNHRVPAGTDVAKIRSVLIWCKQFSHLFAVAPLEG